MDAPRLISMSLQECCAHVPESMPVRRTQACRKSRSLLRPREAENASGRFCWEGRCRRRRISFGNGRPNRRPFERRPCQPAQARKISRFYAGASVVSHRACNPRANGERLIAHAENPLHSMALVQTCDSSSKDAIVSVTDERLIAVDQPGFQAAHDFRVHWRPAENPSGNVDLQFGRCHRPSEYAASLLPVTTMTAEE